MNEKVIHFSTHVLPVVRVRELSQPLFLEATSDSGLTYLYYEDPKSVEDENPGRSLSSRRPKRHRFFFNLGSGNLMRTNRGTAEVWMFDEADTHYQATDGCQILMAMLRTCLARDLTADQMVQVLKVRWKGFDFKCFRDHFGAYSFTRGEADALNSVELYLTMVPKAFEPFTLPSH